MPYSGRPRDVVNGRVWASVIIGALVPRLRVRSSDQRNPRAECDWRALTAHNTSRCRLDRFGRSALRLRTVLKWIRHGPATTIAAELVTTGGAHGGFQTA